MTAILQTGLKKVTYAKCMMVYNTMVEAKVAMKRHICLAPVEIRTAVQKKINRVQSAPISFVHTGKFMI